MDNLTERLLDPKTFEWALQEILIARGQDDLCRAICELHARLRTAKAEGAAEGEDVARLVALDAKAQKEVDRG